MPPPLDGLFAGGESPLVDEPYDVEDHLFSCRHLSTLLDLSIGAPGPDILGQLPPLFERLTSHRMAREAATGADLFQYGPEAGLRTLRRRLAAFLSRRYGSTAAVDPDCLVVTGGATSGLLLVGTFLLRPDAVVFVEDPTYFIALDILAKDLGFRIQPVAMNEGGVDAAALEAAVLAAKPQHETDGEDDAKGVAGRYWGMFYTIPTFHNPTGITTSRATCEKVVDIAAQHGLLVVCDDVYNLLRYDENDEDSAAVPVARENMVVPTTPPSRLKEVDRHGVVISNGTFSKILSPGIRLGWLELPSALVPRLTGSGVLLSGGCINNYMSGLLASMLQLDLMDAHLEVLLQLYRDRMTVAYDYLAAHLPPGWTIRRPGGGYFLWVRADRPLAEAEYAALAARGVRVLAGQRTCPHSYLDTACVDQDFNRACFRISIAYYTSANLLQACRIICEVFNK